MGLKETSRNNKNQMFLSSGLDSSSSEDSSPCCVFHQQASLIDLDDHTSRSAGMPKILSYSGLEKCIGMHKEWLGGVIQQVALRFAKGNQRKNNAKLQSPHSIDDIVVAYISGNSPDMLTSILACSSPETNPAIPALLNTRWTPSEMIASLRSKKKENGKSSKVQNSVTIVLHDDSGPFRKAAEEVSKVLRQANHFTCSLPIPKFSHKFLELATTVATSNSNPPNSSVRQRIEACRKSASNDDALILFTSGTTGGSKGVRLSHRALLVQALAKLDDPCIYSGETAMLASTVPLFHVGGLSSFLAVLLGRGQLIFPEPGSSSKFRVEDISNSLRDPFLPSNTLVVVPAMLSSFFDAEDKRKNKREQFSKARLLLIGGQSASQDILRRCRHSFPNARIAQTYACTEAASSMTFLPLTVNDAPSVTSSESRPNGTCVGSPPSHVELMVCRKASENAATPRHEPITKPYELGLIATRGPHVMNGYWERGSQVATNKSDNRWYISSDLGFFDNQQRLFFAGRAKDVVRTGGETVLAREVEQVLSPHPNIAECAIFPKMDHKYGEAVACAIVARGTTDLSIGAIKAWCQRKGLAGYKQPKYLFLVNALPRNSSGKVLKHKLVEEFGKIELRSKL